MRTNTFGGQCAECGVDVPAQAGFRIGLGRAAYIVCRHHRPVPPPRGAHTGWHSGPLAALDFETTGIDPHRDRLITYAALGPDAGPDLVGIVHPQVPIPESAAEIHGISDADVVRAPAPAAALRELSAWVDHLVALDAPLVVFNAAFDLTLLRAELRRHGISQPRWHELTVIDPFVIDYGIERGRLGSRRLGDVADYYGIKLDNAHDAEADARVARDIAVELGARHRATVFPDRPLVMAQQRFWAAQRTMDYNRLALRRGRRIEPLGDWPFAPET
ncbi:3'-5' exonuclease [Aeromicrobium phragmitis]|uniref:3'-5' exonuclease n=1 Tax=Aeromicrobium phragmitis TaxID=2478914 RepID=A0A3L8PID3_9ACTN|nr:exonuclease domain-containing protein [Aeromicrobium phragmitis]RLV55011.1 3'-5' exonuclease [Aeromicrobium phragmitis]